MHLLVVDDETDLRDLLIASVKHNFSEVYQAADGLQALEIIRTKRIDIVFSDIKMPRMGGLEFLQILRQENYTMPVLIVTGFADKNNAIHALRYGAFDLIEKPFDEATLLRTLRRAIVSRGIEVENDRLISTILEQERNVENLKLAETEGLIAGRKVLETLARTRKMSTL